MMIALHKNAATTPAIRRKIEVGCKWWSPMV